MAGNNFINALIPTNRVGINCDYAIKTAGFGN